MSDIELVALTEIVKRETVFYDDAARKYGELQCDPASDAYKSLYAELDRRGVIHA